MYVPVTVVQHCCNVCETQVFRISVFCELPILIIPSQPFCDHFQLNRMRPNGCKSQLSQFACYSAVCSELRFELSSIKYELIVYVSHNLFVQYCSVLLHCTSL